MSQNDSPMSSDKQFAIEILKVFDELAQPEIKNAVMRRIWNYVLNYIHKIILKKPDDEINRSLLAVYMKLHPKFQQVDMSIEIQKAEALSGVKVPNVGDLARQRRTVRLSDSDISNLLKEYNL